MYKHIAIANPNIDTTVPSVIISLLDKQLSKSKICLGESVFTLFEGNSSNLSPKNLHDTLSTKISENKDYIYCFFV